MGFTNTNVFIESILCSVEKKSFARFLSGIRTSINACLSFSTIRIECSGTLDIVIALNKAISLVVVASIAGVRRFLTHIHN